MVNYMGVQQILFLHTSMKVYSHLYPTNLELGPEILFDPWNVNRCDSAETLNAVARIGPSSCCGLEETMPHAAAAFSAWFQNRGHREQS